MDKVCKINMNMTDDEFDELMSRVDKVLDNFDYEEYRKTQAFRDGQKFLNYFEKQKDFYRRCGSGTIVPVKEMGTNA